MTITRKGHELSLDRLADELTEAWKPIDVAVVNGAALRLARLEGVFRWHHHDEDEILKQYGEEGEGQ